MNRTELQRLAEDRAIDAEVLLAAKRWSGAYYVAGYAIECGLKSCVLSHIADTGVIFVKKNFAADCWTHDIDRLVDLAGLKGERDIAEQHNPVLAQYWLIAKDWSELSRYQQKAEPEATKLCQAVNDKTNGVLQWIKGYW